MNTKNQKRGCDEYVAEYEDIKKSDRVNSAGRASYVERNQWVIDESNMVVFYVTKGTKKGSSGTKISYQYAQRQHVKIIEII